MYEFLDRLVTVAMPRIRDFRGLNARSFDGRGNYAMGLKEQIVFPEISYDRIEKVRGMDIIVTTTAKSDEEAARIAASVRLPLPGRSPPVRRRPSSRKRREPVPPRDTKEESLSPLAKLSSIQQERTPQEAREAVCCEVREAEGDCE